MLVVLILLSFKKHICTGCQNRLLLVGSFLLPPQDHDLWIKGLYIIIDSQLKMKRLSFTFTMHMWNIRTWTSVVEAWSPRPRYNWLQDLSVSRGPLLCTAIRHEFQYSEVLVRTTVPRYRRMREIFTKNQIWPITLVSITRKRWQLLS